MPRAAGRAGDLERATRLYEAGAGRESPKAPGWGVRVALGPDASVLGWGWGLCKTGCWGYATVLPAPLPRQ